MLKKAMHAFCAACLILTIWPGPALGEALVGEWNNYTSAHFVVHYHPGIPHKYIREFTGKCESYYHLITARLGFSRRDLGLEEDKPEIFIYKDRSTYLKNRDRPHQYAGPALIRKRFINTFYFEKDFFDTVLPHELSRIILREFIGQKAEIPLWFEEGLACANEKRSAAKYFLLLKGLVDKQDYSPIVEMLKVNAAGPGSSGTFYAASASCAIFILEDYGKVRFFMLCQNLKDGNSFYAAMDKVYGIKDAGDLREKFLQFVRNKPLEDIVSRKGFKIDW